MNCPKCNSTNLYKRGIRDGKQRYSCKECGISFTDSNPVCNPVLTYAEARTIHCPRGEGHRIFRDGKTENGSQRYRCETCGLSFTIGTNTGTITEIEWGCPQCAGTLIYSGCNSAGNYEYKCEVCGKTHIIEQNENPVKREVIVCKNNDIKCPQCGTTELKEIGRVNDIPNYACEKCGKTFFAKSKPPKEFIIGAVLSGRNIDKLCSKYDYTPAEVNKLMQFYYPREVITAEQKKDIIKYGFYLRVPVDYMAEYIKCSEHKCLETISEYEKKLMSTSFGATS